MYKKIFGKNELTKNKKKKEKEKRKKKITGRKEIKTDGAGSKFEFNLIREIKTYSQRGKKKFDKITFNFTNYIRYDIFICMYFNENK